MNGMNAADLQQEMTMFISGVMEGTFDAEDGKKTPYGQVHGLQALSGDKAVGFRSVQYKAEPHIYEMLKTHNLPAKYHCKVLIRTSATSGSSIKILDAVAVEPLPPKAGK